MTFPMPMFMPASAGALTFVAHGGGTVRSTSFSITPSSAGAQNGDVIIVAASFETQGQAITSPGIITEVVDQNDSSANSRAYLGYGTITDAASSHTWSYGGSNGISYAYSIWRNVSSVSGGALVTDKTGAAGADTFSATLTATYINVVVFATVDGGNSTPAANTETATFSSGVTAQTSGSGSHLAELYWMVGYHTASSTVGYTTVAAFRSDINRFYISVK